MIFFEQLRGELRKLFGRPRTWLGYGAFVFLEAVILFVYQLDSMRRSGQELADRNGLEFGTYYTSLSMTFMMILASMFTLGSIFFALVGGDIVAKESEDGNLRLIFARPVSRFRVLLVKYVAVAVYTISFVFIVGTTGYLMAIVAAGWKGGMLVFAPLMKVFSAFPTWGEAFPRLALASLGLGISMITLSSIAFMFSCFRIKPATATITTLSILFVDFILKMFDFFLPYEEWFVTWRMSCWLYLLEKHIDWAKILDSYAFLAGMNASLFIIGWLAFQTRDFKT